MGVDLTIEVLYVYAHGQLTPGNPQQVHQVRSAMYMYLMLEDFL